MSPEPKTFGFHERRVPVSAWIRHGWTGRASDPVAKLANERVEDAGKIARGLRFALSLLAEPDRAQNERMKPQTEKAIQPWRARFDLVIDRTFFSDMEAEVAVLDDEAAAQGERARWLHELHISGQNLIEDAAASLARGGLRRLRAIVRAQNAFSGSFYKAFPHLRPAKLPWFCDPGAMNGSLLTQLLQYSAHQRINVTVREMLDSAFRQNFDEILPGI
jgi:CRISPR system Cascade subunit CasA